MAKANQKTKKKEKAGAVSQLSERSVPYCTVAVKYSMKADGKTLERQLDVSGSGEVTTGLLADAGNFLMGQARSVVINSNGISAPEDVESTEDDSEEGG